MKLPILDTNDKSISTRLQQLINRWHPQIEQINDVSYFIEVYEDHLQLKLIDEPKIGAISINFLSGSLDYRRKYGGGKRQMIAKAVGLKQGVYPSIVDATAGFGQDAFILASLGSHVHMIERSPIVAFLLEDGLARAKIDEDIGDWVSERLSFEFKNSYDVLTELPFPPDVIYLDPMYPEKKKPALVKKEMRILKILVGEDQDAEKLFQKALKTAKQRVVIKRPAHADWVDGQKPTMSFETKGTRFDLYLVT